MDEQLLKWLKSHGQTFTPDLSEPHAFKRFKNENGVGWYIYKRYNNSIRFTFADWRIGEKHKYESGSDIDFNDPEYIALQEQAEAEREEKVRDARLKSLAEINKSGQNMMTPYLEKKGFTDSPRTTYQKLNAFGEMDLIVPLQDSDGEIWNIQRIEPEGSKSFMTGGRTKGLYHTLTPDNMENPGNTLYVVEGLSTGLSVLELASENSNVVVAFSATNLTHVAKLLREKYPTHKIIVCADNDHLKDLNFGLKAACDAANACAGLVIYPPFTKEQPGTDWNDLIKEIGRDKAKQEFVRQIDTPNSIKDLVGTNYGKEVKPKKKRAKKASSKSQTEFVDLTATEEQIPTSAETTSDLKYSEPNGELDESISKTIGEENNLFAGALVSGTTTGSGELEESEEPEINAKEITAARAELREMGDEGKFNNFVTSYMNGLTPMKIKIGKKGSVVMPSEQEVAHYVLRYFIAHNTPLRRWGAKDLFRYTGTHWQLLDDGEMLKIKNQIRTALRGIAGATKVDACFKTFFGLVNEMPRNPYITDPSKVSFRNKTLHIAQNMKTREWSLKYTKHNPKDFITHHVPYDVDRTATNPAFLEMLDNIFTKTKDGVKTPDPEKQEKLMLIQEMYGACVAPIFPHLFLLHGHGGSGKTSLIKCAMRLVHDDAKAAVEPCEMKGFVLQSLAGRLVNFVTDIKTTEPIEDATIKRIEDRIPIRIDRKFKDAIMAPLPAVNVFGANGIPATKDQTSNAMLRRWSFILVASMDRSETPDFDYANWVFDQCPEGVLAWALLGLERLLRNQGKYTTFKSDRAAIKEWQSGRDSVQQFLDDVAEGQVLNVSLDKDGRAKPLDLWGKFSGWCEVANGGKPRFGKKVFYSSLVSKGFEYNKTVGFFHFKGLKIEVSKDSKV